MIHTQPDLAPMPDFPHSIVSLALGQDHSLALTSNGDVLSWGLNRFSVLGYVLDPPAEGAPTNKFKHAPEEPIQTTPRRIVGPLKKEVVLGVAASRCSSACWTEDAVWTWGENHGHLGKQFLRFVRGTLQF
jgi:alpha-tubulin suppressor-like RCC1 family protein